VYKNILLRIVYNPKIIKLEEYKISNAFFTKRTITAQQIHKWNNRKEHNELFQVEWWPIEQIRRAFLSELFRQGNDSVST
jgi:hypothetical protein